MCFLAVSFSTGRFSFWFSSAWSPAVPCDRCDRLLYGMCLELAWIIAKGGWKRMVVEVMQKKRRASINPHSRKARWKCAGMRQTRVCKHTLLKERPLHTHLLSPVLGAAVLYVACSGLLRNAEQNHKWTRHAARQHKTQLTGFCSLCFCLTLSLQPFPRYFLSLSHAPVFIYFFA